MKHERIDFFMANSIALAQKFLPVIDDTYTATSVTAVLDTASQADFSGASEVKVLKVSTTGLGDYSRTEGYPKGDVTAIWETLKLTKERGKEFSVDRMDDEETLGMAFGAVTGEFMRQWVCPELDAYRFANYASTQGVLSAEDTLTRENLVAAIDEAVRAMDEQEVPEDGRILFVNSELKPVMNEAFARSWGSDAAINSKLAAYNNMPVIFVPKTRFFTGVALNDGTDACGYSKASDAVSINFMIIQPSAVLQAKKFCMPKIFSPDENQSMDMWKFQFRLYHDCFVYDNKKAGVYVHKSIA